MGILCGFLKEIHVRDKMQHLSMHCGQSLLLFYLAIT